MRPFFGDSKETIFHRVTAVRLNSRVVPDALLKFQQLEKVTVENCQISREQLDRLQRIDTLEALVLKDNLIIEEEEQATVVVHTPEAIKSETTPDADPASLLNCLSDPTAMASACLSNPPTAK